MRGVVIVATRNEARRGLTHGNALQHAHRGGGVTLHTLGKRQIGVGVLHEGGLVAVVVLHRTTDGCSHHVTLRVDPNEAQHER